MLALEAKIPSANSVLQAFGLKRPNFKRLGRYAVLVAIIGYLFYQLSRIGFAEIAGALPSSPLFYALSILFVAAPIVAEILAFKTITGRRVGRDFKLFLRKHVLNKAVMNFSGDAFLVQRLSKYQDLNLRRAAIILKDMTLIRAFSANLWIISLVVAAILSGNSSVLERFTAISPGFVSLTALLCMSFCAGAVLLFRKLTRLSSTTALKVSAIYLTRAAIVSGILMAQWSLASPGTSMGAWFIFLIVFSLTKKSPVGGELLFASIVVSLPGLGADNAAIAAMLIAIAGVTQLIYVAGYLLSYEGRLSSRAKRSPARLSALA